MREYHWDSFPHLLLSAKEMSTSFPSLWVWHSLWSESSWCRNALGCQYEAGRIHTSPDPRGKRRKAMVPCWNNQMWRAFPNIFVLPSVHPSWRFGIIRFGVLPSAQQFRQNKEVPLEPLHLQKLTSKCPLTDPLTTNPSQLPTKNKWK